VAEQQHQAAVENGGPKQAEQNSDISIVTWTILLMLVIGVAFCGRFFGYASNPLHIFISFAPLLVAVASLFLLLAGYFMVMKGRRTKTSRQKRTGVLLLAAGLFMLASHFISSMAMPHILG
jgi:uncharacterized membrane protein